MRYRRKPAVIDAFQLTAERQHDNRDWPEWLNRAWQMNPEDFGAAFRTIGGRVGIHTQHGHVVVPVDYWIIQNNRGELSTCRADVFANNYEPAE